MVSSVYARPFDRMPVEVTHLHGSLEGVTPREVVLSLYLLSLKSAPWQLYMVDRVQSTLQVQEDDQSSLPPMHPSFVASGRCIGPDAPATERKNEGRRKLKMQMGPLCYQRVTHTHTRTHTHTHM